MLPLVVVGCQGNEGTLPVPTSVSNISAKPDTGAVTVYWDLPSDANPLFVKVSTKKYPNRPDSNQVISVKASRFADSAVVKGLLHKYKYTFTVQPFTANSHDKRGGKILKTTNPVQPIRRPTKVIYHPHQLTEVKVQKDEIQAKTVDPVGNNANYLVDGDLDTFWQSDWTNGHKPPYILTLNFPQKVSLGAMKYVLGHNPGGFATQWGLAVSKDGQNWHRVWKSKPNLSAPGGKLLSLHFDKNYTSKHFRILILATTSGGGYTCFNELSLYTMGTKKIDLEEQAEENYADHFYKSW